MSDESNEQGQALERDELVQALQAWERLLTGVIGSLESFVTIDEVWRITYVNAAAVQLAQLPAGELLGRDICELTPPHVLEQAWPFLQRAMLEAAVAEFDTSCAATGATFRVRAYPLADGGLALYMRDVTDQARSERAKWDAGEALRESEERLRSVLTNSRDLIYRVDLRTGRYDYISSSAERIVGFSVVELTALGAQQALDLVHPEDQALLRQAVRSSTERGEATVEYRQRTKRGEYRWFSDHMTVSFDAEGRPVYRNGSIRDVTEERAAQKAVSASEERYRQLFQAESDAVLLIDQESGRVLEANAAAEAMYGYSAAEFLALTDLDLSAEPTLSQDTVRTVVAGETVSVPLRMHRRKDGSTLPVEITGRLFDLQGQMVRVAAVRDVSERQRAEGALRENEDVFRAIFDQARVGKWQADPITGRFLRVNEAFCRFTGYSAEELLQCTLLEITHPDDRAADAASLHALREGRGESFESERRYLRPGGAIAWGLVGVNLVRDAAGQARFTVGVVQDITARKEAEEALRESEERFRFLFEDHLAPMLLIEPDGGQIIDANAAAGRFYGYSREQLRAMHIEQINQLPPEEVAAERHRAADSSNNVFVFPHRLASGEVRFVEVYSSPVTVQGRPTLFSIIHDVTERRQAEEALERTRNTLSEAQRIAHLGSFEYVAATGTTVWSEEEYRIYGLEPSGPSPAYDVMLAECIHPDDAAVLHEAFTQAMQSGSVYELEHRIVRPDGSVRWVYDRAHAHLDENGDLLRYVGATLDITERKQAEAALLESEAKHASQQERLRLARDLHDSVTQALFAANLKAEALMFVPDLDARATTLAEDTRRLSRGALAQMRTLLLELRGDPVEDLPLRQLLRQLVEAAEGLTRTEISLQLDGEATLPGDVHVTVYRVVQEALNNVAKHAGAAHAAVQLRLGEVGLHLEVRDDGGGFDAGQVAPGHMGLRSMHERASEVGALLTVESEVGHGTQVTLEWPAEARHPAASSEWS